MPRTGRLLGAGRAAERVALLAALPHVDLLLSGHDLSSLEELAECLPALA